MATKLITVLLLGTLFVSPPKVAAATITVSPGQSIQTAVDSARPGDVVSVRAGTYPAFRITRSGTVDNYLSVTAYPGETVLINANGAYDGILLSGASYVRVSGFEVTGAKGAYGAGITIKESGSARGNYNIVENNRVYDNTSQNVQGILVSNGSYNKIINNKVYNNYLSGIAVISHTSISPNGAVGNEVTGNESYSNTLGGGNTDGIKTEGGMTQGTIISNNIVHGNSDDGIDTWNTSGNTLTGNTSYENGLLNTGDGNGFKLGGFTSENSGAIKYYGGNNTVKGNTAYGNRYNGFDSNGSGANYYENNVAYSNGNANVSSAWGIQDSWRTNSDTRQSTIINNNSYSNKTANYAKGVYTTTFTGNTENSTLFPSPSPTPKPWTTMEGDYTTWSTNYLKTMSGFTSGDFSENGVVDGVDFVLWLTKYAI